jgi:hypothetical protein
VNTEAVDDDDDDDNNNNNNSVLLRLRKVTATRQLKADHSLTVKATKPKIQRKILRLGQKRK